MNFINIKREYQYDGTVHDLMTTDVHNYYGGAFFNEDSGEGKDVNNGKTAKISAGEYTGNIWVDPNKGTTKASNHDYTNSSLYKYENSYMWSPQHGYYTDATAEMIVTPKPLTIDVTGEKTYGGMALTGAETTGVTGSKYGYTVDGLVEGETLANNFTGDLTTLNYTGDKQQLGAGTTKLTDATVGGKTLTNKYNTYNYTISYKGTLKVNKADLYVDVAGSRTYGDANSTGTYTYTAHMISTSDTDKDNDGNLKSWDAEKSEASGKIDASKVTDLNATTDVTHNGTSTNSRCYLGYCE